MSAQQSPVMRHSTSQKQPSLPARPSRHQPLHVLPAGAGEPKGDGMAESSGAGWPPAGCEKEGEGAGKSGDGDHCHGEGTKCESGAGHGVESSPAKHGMVVVVKDVVELAGNGQKVSMSSQQSPVNRHSTSQ